MKTVAIRELSGDLITRVTAQGQILGVTNMGALVGVVLPLTREVIQGMASRDAASMQDSVRKAETEIASGRPMSTLSELLQQHDLTGHRPGPARVSIRELSGARLEQAARDGSPLLISSGRVTLALLIPVTSGLQERLVESGIRRFIDGESPQDWTAPGDASDFLPGGAASVSSLGLEPVPAGGFPYLGAEMPSQRTNSGRDFLRQRAIGIRIIADSPNERNRLQGVVTDMLARPVGNPSEHPLVDIDEGHVLAAILTLTDDLRAYIGPDERLMGVGLEIGGHVHQGRVIYSANAHWGDFPLEDRLSDSLRLPVVLENDANALAIYERRFEGIGEESLAVMLLTYLGVGCGLVLDGHIYRGVRGMAGEIGHIPAAGGDDIRCRCSHPGCLECVATPYAIGEALRKSGFDGGYEAALGEVTSEEVRKKFEHAGAALGQSAATVINLLNPSAMVFYGPSELLGRSREFHVDIDPRHTGAAHPYARAMVENIRSNAFSTGASDCRFIIRSSAEHHSPKAAAACLINTVLPATRALRSQPVLIPAH